MSPAAPTSNARLRVRVKRLDALPIVAVRLWLLGGTRLEKIPGQSLLAGRLLAEGTRHRSFERIARDAEDRGMILESFGTYESIGVSVDALAEDWRQALDWTAELLLEPVFPEDRTAWLCRQARGELESLLDQPDVCTGRAFLEQLYAPHPYSRPLQGDAASLGQLVAADGAAFHERTKTWGGLAVVTGRLDEDAVQKRLEELFAELAGPPVATPAVDPPRGLPERHREIVAGEADQAHLYLGHLTVPRNHPDTPALSVLGVILGAGAGMSGRLPERIREREGLAYHVDVATTAGAGLDPGRLAVYVGTSPRTVDQAERAVREELHRILDEGIGVAELEEARSYLLGREPFRHETGRQWADVLAEAEFYGLETDRPEVVRHRYEALERRDVEAAARRFIRPDELRVTVGLPG